MCYIETTRYIPARASSFLGTGAVEFLSSSSSAGAIVRKSTPARALISPICKPSKIRAVLHE